MQTTSRIGILSIAHKRLVESDEVGWIVSTVHNGDYTAETSTGQKLFSALNQYDQCSEKEKRTV